MVLNLQKNKSMLISSNHTSDTLELAISNENISQIRSENLLGITVDDKLTFDKQIESVSKQLIQKLSTLRRTKRYLPLH